jgi:hypothetical protein
MVELHLKGLGLDARFLPGRFARSAAESSLGSEPGPERRAQKTETEHSEWDGERQSSSRQQEDRDRKERHASAPAQDNGKLLRVGGREQAPAKDEEQENRKTGKEERHGA